MSEFEAKVHRDLKPNQIQNSILAQVAQQDIERAMSQKGFQLMQESQNPDLGSVKK